MLSSSKEVTRNSPMVGTNLLQFSPAHLLGISDQALAKRHPADLRTVTPIELDPSTPTRFLAALASVIQWALVTTGSILGKLVGIILTRLDSTALRTRGPH